MTDADEVVQTPGGVLRHHDVVVLSQCVGLPDLACGGALGDLSSSSSDGSLSEDDDIVRSLPVCIAAKSWSAGQLGTSVLYRYRREGKRLSVGYFVYWTTERPWGPNALSYSVLPALFIDAFYSHLFFMFPGAQRLLHGPGDIEGARIVYEENEDGRWLPSRERSTTPITVRWRSRHPTSSIRPGGSA